MKIDKNEQKSPPPNFGELGLQNELSCCPLVFLRFLRNVSQTSEGWHLLQLTISQHPRVHARVLKNVCMLQVFNLGMHFSVLKWHLAPLSPTSNVLWCRGPHDEVGRTLAIIFASHGITAALARHENTAVIQVLHSCSPYLAP